MDTYVQSDLDTVSRSDLRMARTLLDLYLQLQLADEQIWPLLASAAEQPQHNLGALSRPRQEAKAAERPPPRH